MEWHEWNMKRKCIWQYTYIWPFCVSCQEDNKFSAIHTRLWSVRRTDDLFATEKCDTMSEYEKWGSCPNTTQQTLFHTIFDTFENGNHYYHYTRSQQSHVKLTLNSERASTHTVQLSMIVGFIQNFVVTFVNVTLHRFKKVSDTWENDVYFFSLLNFWKIIQILTSSWRSNWAVFNVSHRHDRFD